MWFSREKPKGDIEEANDINERIDVPLSEKGMPKEKKVGPITEKDLKYDHILYDISCDKQWSAYVSYEIDDSKKNTYVKTGDKEKTFITRCKFVVGRKSPSSCNFEEAEAEPNAVEHFSLEITDLVENAGLNHCKFLSVSPDGRYVVLSFFEKNTIGLMSNPKKAENKYCLIFEVTKEGIFRYLKKKIVCSGRAVFIGKKNYQLAIITKNAVEVYKDFSKIPFPNYVYDLSPFLSGEQQHEELRKDDTYIKNATWADIVSSDNSDFKRIMMISRHIRHNIITTHFVGNIARVWSIAEDGVRFTSFSAKNENIMAFSKNYKYTATHVEKSTSVNIYNVKSGLLVYRLKSQADYNPAFEISHIRFCYGGRYLAMSGIEGNNVVFEVWYIEAEKSIYRKTITVTKSPKSSRCKLIHPFVTRRNNGTGSKCLKGVYTDFVKQSPESKTKDTLKIMTVELEIDKMAKVEWKTGQQQPYKGGNYEIYNNLGDFNGLKGAYIKDDDGKECMIRFGKHTVQLWRLAEGRNEENLSISDEDELLYIRAYKGPDYGVDYSFRDNWQIHNFDSIRFIEGEPSGRVLVNITEGSDNQDDSTYHTEELFLPLKEPASKPGTPCMNLSSVIDLDSDHEVTLQRFDYHKLESACQALHFLTRHIEEHGKNKV